MRLCSTDGDGVYNLVTLSDLSMKRVDASTISALMSNGVLLYGMTPFCMSRGETPLVLLRLLDDDGNPVYFNGHYIEFDVSYYECDDVQIIDFEEYEGLFSTTSAFVVLMTFLYTANTNPKISDYASNPVTYDVMGYSDSGLTLRSRVTGEMFTDCHYSFLYDLYVFKGEAIEDVEKLGDYYIDLGYCKLIRYDEVYRYTNTIWSDFVSLLPDGIRDSKTISIHWRNKFVDGHFNENGCAVLNNCFPVWNLRSHICKGEFSTPLEILDSVVVGGNNGRIFTKDGKSWGSDVAFNVCQLLEYENEKAMKEVLGVFDSYMSKVRMLQGELALNDLMTCQYRGFIWEYTGFSLESDFYMRTSYGNISLEWRNSIFYDNVWVTRIVNCSSCWFSTNANKVIFGTMSKFNSTSLSPLVDSEFLSVVNAFSNKWLRGRICPICHTGIIDTDDGIDIKVLCFVAQDELFTVTGHGLIELPLCLCGGSLQKCGDYYKYDMLIESLCFSKGIFDNLCCDFDPSDMYMSPLFDASKKKSVECLEKIAEYTNERLRDFVPLFHWLV